MSVFYSSKLSIVIDRPLSIHGFQLKIDINFINAVYIFHLKKIKKYFNSLNSKFIKASLEKIPSMRSIFTKSMTCITIKPYFFNKSS